MARIEPFQGLRPRKDLAEKIAAPPYDVLSSDEARELARGNPYSFLHVGKPEIDLPPGTDLYSDEVYAMGKRNFTRFIKEGPWSRTRRSASTSTSRYGRARADRPGGRASCQDYQDDVIKKHELTREDKERDRQRHIETLNAQTGPVFLTYKQEKAIDKLIEKAMARGPENDISTYDGVRHIFTVVDDDKLISGSRRRSASWAFSTSPTATIARAPPPGSRPSARKANPRHSGDEEYNFFLAVIFPPQPDEDPALQPPGQGPERHGQGRLPRPRLRALCLRGIRGKNAVPAPGVLHVPRGQVVPPGGQGRQLRTRPTPSPRSTSPSCRPTCSPLLGIQDPRTDKRSASSAASAARRAGEEGRQRHVRRRLLLPRHHIEQLFAVATPAGSCAQVDLVRAQAEGRPGLAPVGLKPDSLRPSRRQGGTHGNLRRESGRREDPGRVRLEVERLKGEQGVVPGLP